MTSHVLTDPVMTATEGVRPQRGGWRTRLNAIQSFLTVSKYVVGVLLILLVTVIWVASSEWIQYIFGDMNYSKPYFLTYFNTTGFCFWNLGYLFIPSWRVPFNDHGQPQKIYHEDPLLLTSDEEVAELEREASSSTQEMSSTKGAKRCTVQEGTLERSPSHDAPMASGEVGVQRATTNKYASYGSEQKVERVRASAARVPYATPGADVDACAETGEETDRVAVPLVAVGAAPHPFFLPKRSKLLRPYSMRRIWVCASLFCVFWFIANCLFNYSLNATSVASNTALSATSSVWTLMLSFFLPHARIGPMKWMGVAVCVGGTAMVAFSDKNANSNSGVIGDVLAIVSAFFYAAYTTILKLGLPDDERYAMGMVFGAVGVLNLVFLWPGMLILSAAGIEHFQWPTGVQFAALAVNALIGTNLSDVIWARSVVLTSPVIATLGLSLTTPLSMVTDAVLFHKHFTALYITGAMMIMCGFILANLPILDRWRFWSKE